MKPGVQRSTISASQSLSQGSLPNDPLRFTVEKGHEAGASPHELAQRQQLALMRAASLSPGQRVAAGNALAQLVDPRFRQDAWALPDDPLLGFVEIPSGPFLMGSDPAQDPTAYPDEVPPHEIFGTAFGVRQLDAQSERRPPPQLGGNYLTQDTPSLCN